MVVDDAIDVALDEFARTFHATWGIGADVAPEWLENDKWMEANANRALAKKLVALVLSMSAPARHERRVLNVPGRIDFLAQEEIERLEGLASAGVPFSRESGAIEELDFFATAVALEAGLHLRPVFEWAGERLMDIVPYLRRAPSGAVRRYLLRLARCYALEMEPECALMARATIEAGFAERWPDDDIRALRGAAETWPVSLQERIDAAAPFLTPEAVDAANRIRVRGNEVAHGALHDRAADLSLLLSDTFTVLNEVVRGSA